jgi:hypothetical protein
LCAKDNGSCLNEEPATDAGSKDDAGGEGDTPTVEE